jgi:HK97 gp10 family phage protein
MSKGTSIEVDDKAFLRDLQVHLAKMETKTEGDLMKVGLQVQNEARRACPVDTGRLRSSIMMKHGTDGGGFYVTIGTNVEYAAFVEFGTSNMRAQPFLLPAVAKATGFLRSAAR